MLNLSSFVQKAQQLLDPSQGLNLSQSDKNPPKASLFQAQFRLPPSQHPLYEIAAELTIPPPNATQGDKDRDRGFRYVGRLHLSEAYMCFSTTPSSFTPGASTSASSVFMGPTHGGGPSGNGFTFPLCAIRRVERLHSATFQFALAITSWNGMTQETSKDKEANKDARTNREQRINIELAGSRPACERFCDGLKKGLRAGVGNLSRLRKVVAENYSEYLLRTEEKKGTDPPDAGLGMMFKYPGNPKMLRDRAKMRLWGEYLRDNGRNMTLLRQPTFHKLIRVGLPNRLRGEIWELTSGSIYLRLETPSLYTDTLAKYEGQDSLAIDEIEKDLNRSLPEYPGFQDEEGIGRLRRVLTAYSWVNADVGYCQAMNIVVAALLIYMSEAQAFFILSTLCDRLVPGYYSTTMYGTLLDQKVFESLVEKTMPILWEHLVKSDVQLSVVSLPWFLSLYINSMPLVFAFRVLDVFFVEGPKVLFQVGLAILRINGEQLLDAADDGAFISVLKSYFARLDESAHPKSENPKLRAVTKFQELMVVAFKEFAGITHGSIVELRLKNKDAVLNNIESFAKRTAIRNLGPDSKILSTDELGSLYDRFYTVLYERQQREHIIQQEVQKRAKNSRGRITEDSVEKGRVGLGPSTNLMDYDGFREFLAGMSKWAISDSPSRDSPADKNKAQASYFGSVRKEINLSPWGSGPEPAEHEFLRQVFKQWDTTGTGALTLQQVVTGMARIKGKRDIMGTITYFFELYDDDGDGKVDREGILRISEALLFLSRRGLEGTLSPSSSSAALNGFADQSPSNPAGPMPVGSVNERFLGSVSGFIRRCFEYADPDHPSNQVAPSEDMKQLSVSTEDDLADPNSFAIGDDEEDDEEDDEGDDEGDDEQDLLTMDSPPASPKLAKKPADKTSSPASSQTSTTGNASQRRVSKAQTEAANVALDPSNPLHITLPTFRMVVLADELLEQFFESSFPTSFHVVEGLPTSGPATSSSSLTTFSNLGMGAGRAAAAAFGATSPGAPPGQAIAGATRGLRGVLDNIVTDGMRVAAEVRKRMDEAQRELEKNAAPGQRAGNDDDEEEDDGDIMLPKASSAYAGDTERRSVRSSDRDLLEGADAEAAASNGKGDGKNADPSAPQPGKKVESGGEAQRIVEFDA